MDLEEKELIENIKLALNPKVSYWVLFSNGTVIVFDSLANGENIKEKAIKHMKEFGPVWPASAAADFSIVDLVTQKVGLLLDMDMECIPTFIHRKSAVIRMMLKSV